MLKNLNILFYDFIFQYFMMFECFTASTLFYMAHWQTYVTGQMKFGKFDVTEAQIAMISMMAVTGLLGKKIALFTLF
jgi:choline/ethanolamine phosphotransferase